MQFFTTQGNPAIGCKLYTYVAGSVNTPKVTYNSSVESVGTQNTNPIILDSRGEASIYWDGNYKVALYTSDNVLIWEQDNVGADILGFSDVIAPADIANTSDASKGDNLVGVNDGVATTLHFWIKGRPLNLLSDSTLDTNRTNGVDVTSRIQAAIDTGASQIYIPSKGGQSYIVGALNLRNGLEIFGDGEDATLLSWSQVNKTTPISMFNSVDDLSNVHIHGLGLRGNLNVQTTRDVAGQNAAAFRLRAGSLINVCLEDLYIYEFGTPQFFNGVSWEGGGAAGLLGPISGSNKIMRNIEIKRTRCKSIANVPGWYVNANQSYVTEARILKLHNNIFDVDTASARQNCLFALTAQGSGVTTMWYAGVDVDGNQFYVSQNMDTTIELNDCFAPLIRGNIGKVTGLANCTAILLRGSTKHAKVTSNTYVNEGFGCTSNSGFVATPYASTDRCLDLHLSDNTFQDWGSEGFNCTSVDILRLTGNSSIGVNRRIGSAYKLAGCTNAEMTAGNLAKHATNGVVIAGGSGGLNGATIRGNTFDDVGGGAGTAIISSATASENITNIDVESNKVINAVAGTSHFCSLSTAAPTGNYIGRNRIPSGMNMQNPSYAASAVAVTSPTQKTGTEVVALQATFLQSSAIVMSAAGTKGYDIPGAPLALAGALLGDSVAVGCDKDTQGTHITGRVSSDGFVRVHVEMPDGVDTTIAANSTWTVTVIRKQS